MEQFLVFVPNSLFGTKFDKTVFGTVRVKYSEHCVRNKKRNLFGTKFTDCSEHSILCVPNMLFRFISAEQPYGYALFHIKDNTNQLTSPPSEDLQ